jgi:hypothetical protein
MFALMNGILCNLQLFNRFFRSTNTNNFIGFYTCGALKGKYNSVQPKQLAYMGKKTLNTLTLQLLTNFYGFL